MSTATVCRAVTLDETTMHRTVAVSIRAEGYLPPAVAAMVELLKERGRSFFGDN